MTNQQKVIALIEEQTSMRPITGDLTFEAMGLDSLDFILLIQEARTIAPITDAEAQKVLTVYDLIKAMNLDQLSA